MTTHSQGPTAADGAHDDRPSATNEQTPAPQADQGDAAPPPAGDDVRVGPERSDQPQAGATEPTD
jgi:hypothetical protein